MTKVIKFFTLENGRNICFAGYLIFVGAFLGLMIIEHLFNKGMGFLPCYISGAGFIIFGIFFLILRHEVRINKIEKEQKETREQLDRLEGKH